MYISLWDCLDLCETYVTGLKKIKWTKFKKKKKKKMARKRKKNLYQTLHWQVKTTFLYCSKNGYLCSLFFRSDKHFLETLIGTNLSTQSIIYRKHDTQTHQSWVFVIDRFVRLSLFKALTYINVQIYLVQT